MNSSIDLLKTIKVCQDHPELAEQLQKVITDLSGDSSPIAQVKDFSIGSDQVVFYVKTDSNFEAVIKVPKISFQKKDNSSSFFAMHLPIKQAWFLQTLENHKGIIAPRLLNLDANGKFFVETFLPERNLGEAEDVSDDETRMIMNELGETMRNLHSIKSEKFGYIALEGENQGRFDNWFEMFKEVNSSIDECAQAINLDEATIQKIQEIYTEQKDYLSGYNEPRLLHADLSCNNIRVHKENGKWSFNGIIDFADVLSGDPLYDFGEFLGEGCGDWKQISFMEETYFDGGKKFTIAERKRIRFYALYFCLWWIVCANEVKRAKHTKTLYTLINMTFEWDGKFFTINWIINISKSAVSNR